MRYSQICAAVVDQRLFTEEQAGMFMGYPAVFQRCLEAGWLERADKAKVFKMPVYDREDLDACVTRLKQGEIP